MKRLFTVFLVCLLLFSLAACSAGENTAASSDTSAFGAGASQDTASMPETKAPQMPQEPSQEQDTGNILIAYFSRTGTTRDVAESIRALTGGDLIEIEVANTYPEAYDDVLAQARSELQENARPEVATAIENMDDYDTIFIGYPIWHGTCPRVILTFLEGYDLSGITIIPFCTSGSTGISRSASDIREVCSDSTVLDGLGLSGSSASNPQSAVEAWLDELELPGLTDGNAGMPNASEAHGNTINLQVGEKVFMATLADNSSAEALKELLAEGPITIDMRDYGNFEKVGSLGTELPTNNEQITTEPGDLILYQENSFVIYYAPNTWNFTRLGKINDATAEELKETLGGGDVSVTLSLNRG